MLATVIAFTRYFTALHFGIMVAADFAGMTKTRKNSLVLGCYTLVIFVIQVLCLLRFGMDITWKLYPVITHLPMTLFPFFYLKRSWLISLVSMFTAFLCCQPSRWIGSLTSEVFDRFSGNVDRATMNHLGYILSVIFIYFILKKYVAKSVQHLLERSAKSCLVFGAVPIFYYLIDYTTTVYTDFLYSGKRTAVQFMPFIISAFYFVFVLFYYSETLKQARIEKERDILSAQFKQAQAEFATMRQMQQNAATYRHDMRHHFALLQGLASKDCMDEIKEYLKTAQSDLDAITPVRFCENETVNLILSTFAAKSKQAGIQLSIDAKLPEKLPFSDTETCSLLSNALENAIHACENIEDSSKRIIRLRMYSKNNKLCIDIRNSYHIEPVLLNGMPSSTKQGHGYGTKSMVHIVEKYGGIYQFSVKDGWFIFQATT